MVGGTADTPYSELLVIPPKGCGVHWRGEDDTFTQQPHRMRWYLMHIVKIYDEKVDEDHLLT